MKHTLFICLLLLLTACRQKPAENRNDAAAIPASFGLETMHLKTITTFINPKAGRTSTLFGNAAAYAALKDTTAIVEGEKKLVLVTWTLADDPVWFGAMTPGEFLSIETLSTSNLRSAGPAADYQKLDGRSLTRDNTISEQQKRDRIHLMLSLQPAITP
ncbi:hypothetical protein HF324_01725 [Chitinophaga oryzae]|uniref:Cytochrome P460 n=1 Tax=Chitinophaga oryzae TaxID=2725414 RepID=A0AAE7D5G1_9BACT|nr:hypothetical protein [Chitinophaga oryzae]QJB30150.1 hypothetical protein HF329_02015 [Chitinophaga oryzae]QJB36648.1 hypothetical protein HF324_01725 [Chitinophaga oryzae]